MISSEVFPTTRLAVEWVIKNYPNVNKDLITYRMMPGVGTRVIIKETEEVK